MKLDYKHLIQLTKNVHLRKCASNAAGIQFAQSKDLKALTYLIKSTVRKKILKMKVK